MNERLQKNAMQINGNASDIALKFIGFLVSDEERLERFCALSGMGEAELKSGLTDPVMQGFVLDYALSDESLLLAFAADHGLKPEAVVRARQQLPGFSG
jgi:Protein of unknown function (DUF3572)